MSITLEHRKEALSEAYLRAIVAKAGFNFSKSDMDYGFDGTIREVSSRHGRLHETGYGINFQLKSSANVTIEGSDVVYDLESKNYNDLVAERTMLPSILILFTLPIVEAEWINITPNELLIRKCAWWLCLEGKPLTRNSSTKRIRIPLAQTLSPESLTNLMDIVKGGGTI